MATFLFILGIIFLLAAIFAMFRPVLPPTIVSYVGLWLIKWSGAVPVGNGDLLFWGIATIIILVIFHIHPAELDDKGNGKAYMNCGAIVGMVVGMLLSHPGIICGAAIGTILGAIAYSRTPVGRKVKFASSKFVQNLCANGLPAIITACIIGIVLNELILRRSI